MEQEALQLMTCTPNCRTTHQKPRAYMQYRIKNMPPVTMLTESPFLSPSALAFFKTTLYLCGHINPCKQMYHIHTQHSHNIHTHTHTYTHYTNQYIQTHVIQTYTTHTHTLTHTCILHKLIHTITYNTPINKLILYTQHTHTLTHTNLSASFSSPPKATTVLMADRTSSATAPAEA